MVAHLLATKGGHLLDPNPAMYTKLLKHLGDYARYYRCHARHYPRHATTPVDNATAASKRAKNADQQGGGKEGNTRMWTPVLSLPTIIQETPRV